MGRNEVRTNGEFLPQRLKPSIVGEFFIAALESAAPPKTIEPL
jgi:hypothetical protein